MKADLTACPALQKLFKLSLKLSAVLYCQIYPTTIFGCEEKRKSMNPVSAFFQKIFGRKAKIYSEDLSENNKAQGYTKMHK